MPGDWDYYLCEVDGKPASMQVDLAWVGAAPVEALPNMGKVRLRMALASGNGLSSNEEFEALSEVEDALTRGIVDEHAVYVGR